VQKHRQQPQTLLRVFHLFVTCYFLLFSYLAV
jgi:hypothetical protein